MNFTAVGVWGLRRAFANLCNRAAVAEAPRHPEKDKKYYHNRKSRLRFERSLLLPKLRWVKFINDVGDQYYGNRSKVTTEKQDQMLEFMKDEIMKPDKTKFKRKNIK